MSLNTTQYLILFMKRFNCVCHQILDSGANIICDHIAYSRYTSIIRNDNGYWKLINTQNVNPLFFLLAGQLIKDRNSHPLSQLDGQYKCLGYISSNFAQGFVNIPHYKDMWEGFTTSESSNAYYCSLMFNLGRAFLKKFSNIDLPHKLPPTFNKLFNELK